jgi:hypothetical protein
MFQSSIYDNPKYSNATEVQRKDLKELDDNKVFSDIQYQVIQKLPKKHQLFFETKDNYKLLYSLSGDIFSNKKTDVLFIVYDRKNIRISILLYNELTNLYKELYRDIRVQNDLIEKYCYSSVFRTLDYHLCNEIIYQKDNLIKNPKILINYEMARLADITDDERFVLSDGCFSNKLSKNEMSGFKSLCISTDSVYNNWECLKYDKNRGIFILFYSQAFAD